MPSRGWQFSDDDHAVKVSVGEAQDFGARVLVALGSPADIAEQVAGWLVGADLAGHSSHGIVRLMDYADRIARGTLDPAGRAEVRPLPGRAADGPVVLVDAHKGFGHPAAALLTDELVERARANGVATGGAVNVSHTGRLGEWSERAARDGVILFLCYAGLDKSNVAAFGAREARLGTNPLTFGVPAADGDALILDMATSAIAGGKIQHHIAAGTPAPPGALLDRDGLPTTDPAAFADGGMLSTFGGHKGYGLALIASVLAGSMVGQAADDLDHGVFAVAVDPGCFAPRETVASAVSVQLDRMRSTPPAPGVESVQVPGDYERAQRAAGAGAVQIPDAIWVKLADLARSVGVS
jgi:LDH2 family malate/lactate/ureidoglycolate dehydrogenase